MNSLLPLGVCVTKYRVDSYALSFFSAPGLNTDSALALVGGIASSRLSPPGSHNLDFSGTGLAGVEVVGDCMRWFILRYVRTLGQNYVTRRRINVPSHA